MYVHTYICTALHPYVGSYHIETHVNFKFKHALASLTRDCTAHHTVHTTSCRCVHPHVCMYVCTYVCTCEVLCKILFNLESLLKVLLSLLQGYTTARHDFPAGQKSDSADFNDYVHKYVHTFRHRTIVANTRLPSNSFPITTQACGSLDGLC